jgi:signal transduction histidine kinase
MYMEKDMNVLYKMTNQASQAVSRLREVVEIEKRKLSSMVESMGDGVLMVDSRFQVLVANPAIRKIVKFGNEKPINIFDFVDALGGKFDIRGRLEEAVAKNLPYTSEKVNIDSSFFEIGVYPVTHSLVKGGVQVLGAVVVFHDITRDIELEKVREEFTSMVVHELRSPLDGIKKIIEFILSESIDSKSEQFNEYMNMVHQSSASMLELVNDILDISKLQAGKFTIEKEQASIKDVIENRIAFYKVSASTRKLSLEMNLSPNLPETALFDPKAIKQILNNLLSNALKFTSQGGLIVVSAFIFEPGTNLPEPEKSKAPVFPGPGDIKAKERSLCVVISDTGIGIPSVAMDDLFKNYQQAKLSPVAKDVKGTGLGLAIAKGVAEAHGGTVGAVSKEGAGSSFFFTIPL